MRRKSRRLIPRANRMAQRTTSFFTPTPESSPYFDVTGERRQTRVNIGLTLNKTALRTMLPNDPRCQYFLARCGWYATAAWARDRAAGLQTTPTRQRTGRG